MAAFGSTGFSGFGQNNNNNNQNKGFGAFGNTAGNTPSAFGAPAASSVFGAANNNNTPNSLFGGTTGFGAQPGPFATNNTPSLFGQAASNNNSSNGNNSTGLFNNANAANTNRGAFGNTVTNNNNAPSTFGNTAGIFGGAKPTAFGAPAATTSTGLFGNSQGNASSTGFGLTTTTAFGGAISNTGLGVNASAPGTNVAPFAPVTEREPNSTTMTAYQNITAQEVYKKWSTEELRLTDYAQGRRFGNSPGGGFGMNNTFGGGAFGNAAKPAGFATGTARGTGATTGASIFGNNSNTTSAPNASSPFGQPAATSFGNNSTGMFSNSSLKPTGTGIFGNPAQPTQAASNTMFTGFGGTANTTTPGNSIFGNNNAQPKPSGFGTTPVSASGFGTTGMTTSSFGTNTATNQPTSSLFNNPQQTTTGQNMFGTGGQATTTGFGTAGPFGTQAVPQNSTGSLLGTNQPMPLFPNSTTNTGSTALFGSMPGSTFGEGLNHTTGTTSFSLMGVKPNNAGSFGIANNTQGNNTVGSILGGSSLNQSGQGSSLFGPAGQNEQRPSMFAQQPQQGGNGFFSFANQTGSSILGNATQLGQAPMLGSSLLGGGQQQYSAAQPLTASLTDFTAYGNSSLFANISNADVSNPGPLATPVSNKSRPSSVLPIYKLNPPSASRFVTPQKRGFGFSYSNVGTPGSVNSNLSSPAGNFGRSNFAASGGRGLSKSMSTSSLRRNFNPEDSILAPGAFSPSFSARTYNGGGSAKRLVIDRDLRSDLFSPQNKDRDFEDVNNASRKLPKRVSFDTDAVAAIDDGAPVPTTSAPRLLNGGAVPDAPSSMNRGDGNIRAAEMEQVRGKELVIVHEEDFVVVPDSKLVGEPDKAPGKYWMRPSKDVLASRSKAERTRVSDFVIGRENVGSISFKQPVDLSSMDLDEICDGFVVLQARSATVYPDPAKKPPVGRGLNVPATIALEHSWPRGGEGKGASDARRLNRHVERLRRIPDTQFEKYDGETGVWIFSVEHFTTYGLEYEDEATDGAEEFNYADGAVTATDAVTKPFRESSGLEQNDFTPSPIAADDADDTFYFRKKRVIPGAFDSAAGYAVTVDGDDDVAIAAQYGISPPSFRDSSVGSTSHQIVQLDHLGPAVKMDEEYDVSDQEGAMGPSARPHHATERDDIPSQGEHDKVKGTPGGILRARMRALKEAAGPIEVHVPDGDDWMEMLRKSISPVKGGRQVLRAMQTELAHRHLAALHESASVSTHSLKPSGREGAAQMDHYLQELHNIASPMRVPRSKLFEKPPAAAAEARGFGNSIDLMRSIFDENRPGDTGRHGGLPFAEVSKGSIKWPYKRHGKLAEPLPNMDSLPQGMKPRWGLDGALLFLDPESHSNASDPAGTLGGNIRTAVHNHLRIAKLSAGVKSSGALLQNHIRLTVIETREHTFAIDGEQPRELVPSARVDAPNIRELFHGFDTENPASVHEALVWELASILFDRSLDDSDRMARFLPFWDALVKPATQLSVALASTNEEKALASLAGHMIYDACAHLVKGRNFRLATLVPLIGTNERSKKAIKEQLKMWQEQRMLSEFSQPIRAIYELLGGNACVCEGLKAVPMEDRYETFVISQHFGLDWKRAFGLRLWYVAPRDSHLADVVKRYEKDVEQDREARPAPWYIEQGIAPLWNDSGSGTREELLWGLLRLYADKSIDLESVLRPENSQLSPLDCRLSWQLGIALVTIGSVSFGTNGEEKLDASTISLASQLISEGDWISAVFVLIHLSAPTARMTAIKNVLCQHAGSIGDETSEVFTTLVGELQIPAYWVWEARALYMRSVKRDYVLEANCLLSAGSFTRAHQVLVERVAPLTVVEYDFSALSSLLSRFAGHEASIRGWQTGGAIYQLFIEFAQIRAKRASVPVALLDALLAGLPALAVGKSTAGNSVGKEDYAVFVRRAAVACMADEVSKVVLASVHRDEGHILSKGEDVALRIQRMPLTSDKKLRYALDQSWACFRNRFYIS